MNKNSFTVPSAIVLAGILVAGAILLSGYKNHSPAPSAANPGAIPAGEITMKAVSADDHRMGDPNAKVIIVEYADLECPYCKQYEPVLHQVLDSYGPNGGVAWVYRHFPIHSRGPYEAEASECAAELGGNDIFFKFIDQIFTVTKADDNLDPAVLTKTATSLGLDTKAFQTCLDSKKYESKIQDSYNDAVQAGGRGTPFTVLVTRDGHKYPLSDSTGAPVGAVSFADLKGVVDNLLKQVK